MSNPFLVFIFALAPAYLVYLVVVYARTRVPYAVTTPKRLSLILEHMHITPDTVIVDLGSGKGDVLFAAEKFHPKQLIGYELSPLHAWYAKMKSCILGSKVQIFQKDFFTANISDADIIYIFLVQSMVEKIWVKIQKEAKPGAKVFVLSNTIPGLHAEYVGAVKNGVAVPGGFSIYTL